jgi:hypothetical protein
MRADKHNFRLILRVRFKQLEHQQHYVSEDAAECML